MMAHRYVNMTVRLRVKVDPDGKSPPTMWRRAQLALWILMGRPVMVRADTEKE